MIFVSIKWSYLEILMEIFQTLHPDILFISVGGGDAVDIFCGLAAPCSLLVLFAKHVPPPHRLERRCNAVDLQCIHNRVNS